MSCRSSSYEELTRVSDFRSKGLTDDEVIQKAINTAGEGGIIVFENSRVYHIENQINVKAFQSLIGNNATLRRSAQSYAHLTSAADETSDTILVDHVPAGWKEGDQLQVYTDSSVRFSNSFGHYPELPNLIRKIYGNKIILSSGVGASENGEVHVWPAGAVVRKVFTMLSGDSIQLRSAPFSVSRMRFDGNRSQNNGNYYWNVNACIFMRGTGGKIEDCYFTDMPNETIVGQGMTVLNCYAFRLNGSFVHLSGNDTIMPYSQRHAMIIGNTINEVCLISTQITGHSEGSITTSHNGGYATIANNRIFDCGEAAIGTIDNNMSIADAGKSELIITGNFFKRCKKIFHYLGFASDSSDVPTDVCVMNNVFSYCGTNFYKQAKKGRGHTGLRMENNIFTNQTSWKFDSIAPR